MSASSSSNWNGYLTNHGRTGARLPLLLDTDIGSDIDDAVCLAYLLRQPRCELMGITTVSGQPAVRAALADAVCRDAGRSDVPIHAGLERALGHGRVVQPDVPQAAVLPRFSHRAPREFEPATAVAFLRQAIRDRPGEVTLLAIGPMTNVAALFAVDPEIPRLLKGLVLMCGVFTQAVPEAPRVEWNASLDARAAELVYQAPARPHLSVGLDVTLRCRTPSRETLPRFSGVVAAMTEAWAHAWGESARDIVFHDPLAAALLFEPDLCAYAAGQVIVDAESGSTRFTADAAGPHRVAVSVEPARFFAEYWSVAA